MGCSTAFDTCPDAVPSGKTTHTWVGLPTPIPFPFCPTVLTFGAKISQKFHLQATTKLHTLGIQSEGETGWAASSFFMTRGSERVLTSQEPTSPTLTSRSWRHICLPATPQQAHCPLQACPSSSAFFTGPATFLSFWRNLGCLQVQLDPDALALPMFSPSQLMAAPSFRGSG